MNNVSPYVIVAGGAGYIGSHAALLLKEQGKTPVIYDNLSRGNTFVQDVIKCPFVKGDLFDEEKLIEVFREYQPSAVMHFAAFAYVGESVRDPLSYYHTNVAGAVSLLRAQARCNIPYFIFSSTCATYGRPQHLPITEHTPQTPINPYGHSKLLVEEILKRSASAHGIKFVAFRYFNAAGGDPEARIGETHDPETHLIPLAIEATSGKRELTVFGTDYDTPDGSCVRDYIHVNDIAEAHLLGLSYLERGGKSDFFNLGTEKGNSVLEVINTVEEISGEKVAYRAGQRREGDPPSLVASANKARKVLGWKPKYPALKTSVEHAWKWWNRGE